MLNTNTIALQSDNSEATQNNNLQIINGVRTKVINQEIFLSLEDISKGLGFTQEKNNVIYIRWETVFSYLDEFGFSQLAGKDKFIPENVFYKLCFKAKNEIALNFQNEVTDKILPSIRKNGMYATEVTIDKMLSDPDFAISLLTKLKEEKALRIKVQEEKAILLHTSKLYTSTELAKECNLKSAIELNKILHDKKVQFKQNGTWVLYTNYSNKSWTSIKQTVLDSGRIIYDRMWTGMGREAIINLINSTNV